MLDSESSSLLDILLDNAGARRAELQEAFDAAVEEHENSGKPLMDVIVDFGLYAKADILQLIANNLGSEVVDLNAFDVTQNVINKIDPEVARTQGVIPIEFDGELLRIVSRHPLDYRFAEDLQFRMGCSVQVCVADPDIIDNYIERYYPQIDESLHDVIAEMGDGSDMDVDAMSTKDITDLANDPPIVKFVNTILMQGIKDKAADIHFEPFEHHFRIRYRVDGTMYELPQPPKGLAIPVTSRIKIVSGLNISERRKPQDGRIQLKFRGKPVDLRVSCLPTTYGESVVLRILDRSVVNLDLEVLGIGKDVLQELREMIAQPNGILLVTGPTGSGKTTTLYSALKEVNQIDTKILTAEDPVEYDLEGIVQVPINDAVGMTFERALRAFLRQDPDRIMVGEIRDYETAQIAIESSLTGHFVFSTLHTNDAAGTVTRLIDMGIEPFLVCSSLTGVLSQRLIRRVCYNCKTAYDPDEEELRRLNLTREQLNGAKFYRGRGCQVCNNTGYKGRKAITELLKVTPEIRTLIYNDAPTEEIRAQARKDGMRTIQEDGLLAIVNGEASVEEVLRYTAKGI